MTHTQKWTRLWKRIQHLDLRLMRFQLLSTGEMAAAEIDAAERDYRRFLFLAGKHRDMSLVPSRAVDAFWHAHLLDTRKYERDMCSALGFFLHHFPYLGLRGSNDRANLASAFEETLSLLRAEFGDEAASACTYNVGLGTICGGHDKRPHRDSDSTMIISCCEEAGLDVSILTGMGDTAPLFVGQTDS